ncbi:P-loop containing nucleoside triphosphate hydrolase protein [Epithele typhae]|uniref:P-loop containing nucleoside triphosphate hydrolase protein n=1 Tax=Epithele typhae TaxID=378194 RepID=UPI002007905A|nr:P-loop containing nucleoside triphosphate hydrolase protein [Epithele typhae]KAH9935192.1 P-loop containing nucleoside triphosphate hydrolase protein [Epithele typhae]
MRRPLPHAPSHQLVMGPSGAGKSTLLDLLARRTTPSAGKVLLNGEDDFDITSLASYVEQSDALLGVLTVKETLYFSARLSLDPSTPADVIHTRVEASLRDLGLTEVADNRIGTAIQRGVSGGQKRRVTIGASLVTLPRILFLDEPTSGLDSRTSTEVLSAIKTFALRHGVIVIATIHQPNWETFSLFDKLLLLAHGREVYYGPIKRLDAYLADGLNHPVPLHANPSDHALDVVSTDFITNPDESISHIARIQGAWEDYAASHSEYHMLDAYPPIGNGMRVKSEAKLVQGFKIGLSRTWYLVQRNWINYSRNLLAYGVRLGMYLGMGILLATVWVNLPQTSAKINDRLSVHFFSVAFLGFMSVAGIPAFLEERQVFIRERLNGQYGAGPYVLANSLVTLPYLFACALLFAVLSYWSIGLHPGAGPFFRFLGILFLAVYAAESQSALIAAMVPIFVAALALASFLNGFWMCVGGYFIKAVNLPRFWYYWAHFIDFQTYAFDLLVYNDLKGLTFACETLADGSCFCDYPSSLIAQGECALAGEDVLNWLDINGISFKLYASVLLMITLVYRLLLFIVLSLKKR